MIRTSKTEATDEPTDMLRLHDAALRMGISYPTLKQWIYKRKIRVARTAGGHYRVPSGEVERLCVIGPAGKSRKAKRGGIESVSARNKLLGTVIGVKSDGIMAQVTLDIGGQFVTAVITRDALRALGLKPGVSAYAILKATEVMMIRA